MQKIKRFLTICVLLIVFLFTCNIMYATGLYTFSIAKKLIALGITTVFSSTYDIATPAGTDDPSEADDRMREIKAAIQERENIDHFWPLAGTEVSSPDVGEHRKIRFHTAIADPTPVAGHAVLFLQEDELRYQNDSDAAFYFTNNGKLGHPNTDLVASFLTCTSGTDNRTADFSSGDTRATIFLTDPATTGGKEEVLERLGDVLTLSSSGGDNRLGTSTANATDTARQIADKGYVDDSEIAWAGSNTPAVVFNTTVTSTNTWQDLNLSGTIGSKHALCFFEVKCSGGGIFRIKQKGLGSTTVTDHDVEFNSGCANINFFQNNKFGYVTMSTNSSGIVEIAHNSNSETLTIRLLGFIRTQ